MLTDENNIRKFIRTTYSYILPVITIFFLLVISQLIKREKFLGSETIDLGVRIFLCFWFVIGYRSLPKLSKQKPTSVSKWTKADFEKFEKIVYIGFSALWGIVIPLITWWAIQVFLPISNNISVFIAILNGLLFSIPVIANYHVFKP